ncbi:MAG: hypothetical protein IT377_27540 [Polyangiaceae bacterium]|nr:hypothetical protein [Polyangiaceae bacterium]
MLWNDFSDEAKAPVFEALEREAERLERDAVNLQRAAQQLGRPSLVESTELRANAFRAAIQALGGPGPFDD